jgi:hypothetical protein
MNFFDFLIANAAGYLPDIAQQSVSEVEPIGIIY